MDTEEIELEKISEDFYMDDSSKMYLREISKIPLLKREEVQALGERILEGDASAIEEMVKHNLRLVVSLAKGYVKRSKSLSFLDLVQEGNIGLYKAAKLFDVRKGYQFSTYATYWIRQSITRALQNKDEPIRRPVHQYELLGKLQKKTEELFKMLDRNPTTLELATALGMSEEQVKKAYDFLYEVHSLNKKVGDDDTELGAFLEDTKISTPEAYVVEKLYSEEVKRLLDHLKERERKIIQMRFGLDGEECKTLEEVSKIFGLTRERIRQIEVNALKKLRQQAKGFIESESLPKEPTFSYLDIYNTFKDEDFFSFLQKNGEFYESLDAHSQKILYRFLEKPASYTELTREDIEASEKEIQMQLWGYGSSFQIPLHELEKSFYQNAHMFTETQKEKIEMGILDEQRKKLKTGDYYILMDKLENVYFGIDRILEMRLTREQIIEVLKKKYSSFTQEELRYMDSYYGLSGERISIIELAQRETKEYQNVHDTLFTALERALKFYVGYPPREKEIEDKTIYYPYIDNFQYELTGETRNLLRLYLKEGKSYEEIHEKTGLPKNKISNMIQDGIRCIDFYRFGILKANLFTKEDLREIARFKKYKRKETSIIKKRYFEGKSILEIQIELGIEKSFINSTFKKFNAHLMQSRLPENVSISFLMKEISLGPFDSVISDMEKKVICMHYGFSSQYNPSGKTYTLIELTEFFHLTKDAVNHTIYSALAKVKKRYIGLLDPEYGLIPTECVRRMLEDPHLPLKEDDKTFLRDLLGFNGEPKSKEEIMEIYHISEVSVKRKYQRAILTLKKYEVGEIEPIFSYEADIMPVMKYFCADDRMIIEAFYKEKVPLTRIAKKWNLSLYVIQNQIKRIQIKLLSILKKKDVARLYDFTYANEVTSKEDFPLVHGKEKAIEIYQRYFGENGYKKSSTPEIIEEMELSYGPTAVHRAIENVMKNVLKYQMGARKEISFSYEQIKEYYENHYHALSTRQKWIFKRFLNRDYTLLNGERKAKIPAEIIYLLAKENLPIPFSFKESNKMDATQLLQNKAYHFSHQTRKTIQTFYNISNSTLMSGSEKNKVFKILKPLYIEKREALEEKYTKKKV